MLDLYVSNCVLNILGSFSNSLGLYKKLKERRKRLKRVRKNDRHEGAEELRLTRSLRQGPEDINREYQNSLALAGDGFAVGDAIAQTSLAEVLLRLNVGLVGIINSFLTSDRNSSRHVDYRGLADLAESSRIDTCHALRSLLRRLTSPSRLPKTLVPRKQIQARPDNVKAASSSNLSSNRSRNTDKVSQPRPKIRGQTLAQVIIQDSSKPPQLALVRPGERRKKVRGIHSESTLSSPRQDSAIDIPPPGYSPQTVAQRTKTSSDVRKPRRKRFSPNNAPGSSRRPTDNDKHLRTSQSTPRLQTASSEPFETPPSMPTIPDNIPPVPATNSEPFSTPPATPNLLPLRRKPNPTYYSIATNSTKLGEIPLHKWAQPYDFDRMELLNREAYRNGWPNVPDEGAGEGTNDGRRRRGFWGLFRRRSD